MNKDTIYRQAAIDALVSRQTVLRCIKESREDIDWGQSEDGDAFLHYSAALYRTIASEECVPSAQPETCVYWDRESNICALHRLFAQPEDYAELKREFLRMASYIDVLLECSDEQKETLIGFISRLAEFMPWTERD